MKSHSEINMNCCRRPSQNWNRTFSFFLFSFSESISFYHRVSYLSRVSVSFTTIFTSFVSITSQKWCSQYWSRIHMNMKNGCTKGISLSGFSSNVSFQK